MTVNKTQKTKVDVEQTRVNRADNNNHRNERKSTLKELALIQEDRRSTEVSENVGMWGESSRRRGGVLREERSRVVFRQEDRSKGKHGEVP